MNSRARLAVFGLFVVLSGACRAHRTPATSASTTHERGALVIDGRERTYLMWSPVGSGPFPLVLALHGRLGDGAGMEELAQVSRLTKEGALVVAPDGYEKSWADARGTTPASSDGIDDVRFLSQLIDDMIAKHHADPTRVYVMGMSNGGMMALTLACRITDRLAGVITVTGLMSAALVESCRLSKPLPVAFIHGTNDPIVPYEGGGVSGGGGTVQSADASAQFWAHANGCAPPTRTALPDVARSDETTTTLHGWSHCRDNAEVRLYSVEGGGHTWPGGKQYLGKWLIGRTSQDFSATDEGWRFLQAHRRQ